MTQMFCGAQAPAPSIPRRGSLTLSGQTFGSKQETRGNTVHWNTCPRVIGDGGDI